MSRNFELMQKVKRNPDRVESFRQGWGHAPAFTAAKDSDHFDLVRAWTILKKRWKTAAMFAVSVFAVVALLTFLMKPVYAPSAAIQIDPPGTAFSLDPRQEASDTVEYLETAAINLQSSELLLAVIRKLHLDENPEFSTPKKSDNQPGSDQRSSTPMQLPPATNRALGAFRDKLKVERNPQSRLIKISVASHDPRLAAEVTNTLASEYIENTYSSQHNAILESSSWASRQLDDIRARMNSANRALIDYQRETGIMDVDTNKSSVGEQIAEFNRQLAQAEGDRIQAESYLHRARSGDADSLPQIGESKVIQDLSGKLAEARANLTQAQVLYGKNHPNVRTLTSHASELERQLTAQKRRIVAELSMRYSAARQRENLLRAQLKSTGSELNVMARYNLLKKEAQTESELYNSLYARVKEAGIAAASKTNNIRIVDKAHVLDEPTRPHRLLNLIAGLLAGLIGGIILAFGTELFDTRLHTAEDVLHTTGVSSISILPRIRYSPTLDASSTDGGGLMRSTVAATERIFGERGPEASSRILLDRPESLEAEAIRGLYTNIVLSRRATPPQVIVVVSSYPREGKTTVASNLAIMLAQQHTTCLVDADLRKNTELAKAFKIDGRLGLSEVLAGVATPEEAIVAASDVRRLSVLPRGQARQNPAELMTGQYMQDTVHALRANFQFVVVDSPPIIPYADARILSTLADGVVLVARCGITTRDALARSIELLNEIQSAPIIDIVLNGAASLSPEYHYQANRYRRGA